MKRNDFPSLCLNQSTGSAGLAGKLICQEMDKLTNNTESV